ncbi:MAG: AAA family ATPase [Bacteroidota bacterium]
MNKKGNIKQRISYLLEKLNEGLFEKEKIVGLAFLSAIAGESIFLLGPPGVAKSMAARRLKYAFKDARSFEYLMGKFSTPDEVFGPVSISKLKDEDKYERLTDNYLPGANIVFLDEIWKSSPPIQNSLLTVLNEKIFRNGDQVFKVNIRGLISASNELPLKGEGLEAIYDRFLIRLMVGGIQDEELFNRMITMKGYVDEESLVDRDMRITDEEYEEWEKQIDEIEVPDHILGLIQHIRKILAQRNVTADAARQIYVSDRRWRKITRLLRSSAFLNGRKEVIVMDCFLIEDCIWDREDEIQEASDLVLGCIASFGYRKLVNLSLLTEELDSLKKEIRTETQEVIVENIEVKLVHKDDKGQEYFRLRDFWGDSDVFIRVQDFEKVRKEEKAFIPIFEEAARSFRPFQTAEIEFKSELSIENKGKISQFDSEEKEIEKVISKEPSQGMVRIWDAQIKMLLETCENQIEALEQQKLKDEGHMEKHLFLEETCKEHVLKGLDQTTHDLLDMKLEIEKTRHAYESMAKN